MRVRPSIYVTENNHLLTMRYEYGGKEVYNLPGGNLELGEHMAVALQRELKEELQVDVEVGELKYVGEVHLNNKVKLHCIFDGKISKGVPELNPKETTALEIVWLPLNRLERYHLYPNIATYINNQSIYLGKLPQKWF